MSTTLTNNPRKLLPAVCSTNPKEKEIELLRSFLFAAQQETLSLAKKCEDAENSFSICDSTLTAWKKNYTILEKENDTLKAKLKSCEFSSQQKDIQIRKLSALVDQAKPRPEFTPLAVNPWCRVQYSREECIGGKRFHWFTLHIERGPTQLIPANLDFEATTFFATKESTSVEEMSQAYPVVCPGLNTWEIRLSHRFDMWFVVQIGGIRWYAEIPSERFNSKGTAIGMIPFGPVSRAFFAQKKQITKHFTLVSASTLAEESKKRKREHCDEEEAPAKKRKIEEFVSEESAADALCNMLVAKK